MSGEEAYQRRQAMSTLQPVSQAADAALTTNATEGASTTTMGPLAPPPRAETGEEAYLRRVAMSQQGPPQPLSAQATLSQPPKDVDEEVYGQHVDLLSQQTLLPPSQAEQDTSGPSDSSGYNPFAPQSVPPPPPPSSIPSAGSTSNVTTDFEERVRNSRSAAAAIAAKFSALASAEGKDSLDPAPVESVLGLSERYAY
jgi:splicing factor 45